jgi:uncharacterized protein (DUF302 family)
MLDALAGTRSEAAERRGDAMTTKLGFDVALDAPCDEAIESVTEALAAEGFGVLTRIDVQATLREKIGEDFRPYVILGACNPRLAHRALGASDEVGLMLPCNVTVEAVEGGGSRVRIADPGTMMTLGELARIPALEDVAAEARTRLGRVADALATADA